MSELIKTYLVKDKHLDKPEYILNGPNNIDMVFWKLTPDFFEFVTQNIENIELSVETPGYNRYSKELSHEFALINPVHTGFVGSFTDPIGLFKPYMITNSELAVLAKVIFH